MTLLKEPRPVYTEGTVKPQMFQAFQAGVDSYPSASSTDINDLVNQLRRYARQNHISMLELIAEQLVDELPFDIGRTIKDKVEQSKPKVKPGEVEYWGTFASGRSDISERMEEIIYGSETDDEN